MTTKEKSLATKSNSKYNPALDRYSNVDIFSNKTSIVKKRLKGRDIEKEVKEALVKVEQSELFDFDDTRRSVLVLRAINHKLRQRIIETIRAKHKLSISEISKSIKLESSTASQHVSLIKRAGIIISKKENGITYYELDFSKIAEVNKAINLLTLS